MPFDYTLTLSDCATGDLYKTMTVDVANPHPACTVSGTIEITSTTPVGDTTVVINQDITS